MEPGLEETLALQRAHQRTMRAVYALGALDLACVAALSWELVIGSAFIRQELCGYGSAIVLLTFALAAAALRARSVRRRVLEHDEGGAQPR